MHTWAVCYSYSQITGRSQPKCPSGKALHQMGLKCRGSSDITEYRLKATRMGAELEIWHLRLLRFANSFCTGTSRQPELIKLTYLYFGVLLTSFIYSPCNIMTVWMHVFLARSTLVHIYDTHHGIHTVILLYFRHFADSLSPRWAVWRRRRLVGKFYCSHGNIP